jgi:hypothetical protein
LLREALVYRRATFCKGLQAAGYELVNSIPKVEPQDVLCVWNRYAGFDEQAKRFAKVLVAENAYVDAPGKWVALSLSHHNGAGEWKQGSNDRWDSLGIELLPWRHVNDGETLIIGQRGIGEKGLASPMGWAEATKLRIGGRIRKHPHKDAKAVPLEQDLERVSQVVTWGSSAALRSLMYGIPVWYEFPKWIGAGASKPLADWGEPPKRDDEARLACFRRLIWAQWRLAEIESGEAFRYLLQ